MMKEREETEEGTTKDVALKSIERYKCYNEEIVEFFPVDLFPCSPNSMGVIRPTKSKPNKRILVLTNHRVLILQHKKIGRKQLLKNIHLYDLAEIESTSRHEVHIPVLSFSLRVGTTSNSSHPQKKKKKKKKGDVSLSRQEHQPDHPHQDGRDTASDPNDTQDLRKHNDGILGGGRDENTKHHP